MTITDAEEYGERRGYVPARLRPEIQRGDFGSGSLFKPLFRSLNGDHCSIEGGGTGKSVDRLIVR